MKLLILSLSQSSSYFVPLKDGCLLGCWPCSLVEVYRHFRSAFCLYHQNDNRPDNGGGKQTSTNFYHTTRHNIPEDRHLHTHRSGNLKFSLLVRNVFLSTDPVEGTERGKPAFLLVTTKLEFSIQFCGGKPQAEMCKSTIVQETISKVMQLL
jgi:hypothetical protein